MNAAVRTFGSFADRVGALLKRVEYVRAEAPEQQERIFKLRYDAYLKERAILPSEAGALSDAFDASVNGMNFAIYIDGKLTSALRLHVLSPSAPTSPAQQAFSEFLDPLVEERAVIVDPNRFVADYALARFLPQLPYVTLRLSYMLADYVSATYVTCTVRSEHRAFYRREYFAESLCEPRPYPTLIKPLGLMIVNFEKDREAIRGRHEFYSSTAAERQALFGGSTSKLAAASQARS